MAFLTAALLSFASCFAAWLAERGHLGNYEDAAALEQVRRFFIANQYTRFADWHDSQHRPANLVGYRRAEPEGITFHVTGPAGFSGSLIGAEFASLEAARAWADADPYVAAGVYARVTIKPFKKVF